MIRSLIRSLRKVEPIRLLPSGKSRGTVVISYMRWPFVEGWDSPKARGHTNAYECLKMAEAYRSLGCTVEAIDYTDTDYVPPADTLVAIDIHSNLERWSLPSGCTSIVHATGPHWLFWNHAELTRLSGVRNRHGIALKPRRQVEPSRAIECANMATVLGNQFTIDTFAFAGKPVHRIPISSAYEFPWPENRDFETARRKFLWVGSYGMVHKGLDLALDAFAGLPDLELTVGGRPEKEDDFTRLYAHVLKDCKNIHYHGWLDMADPVFMEMARTHATIIYPSSAEGGAGSVIHCMHAGMVPATTREASIDLGDFGVAIESADVEAVRRAARAIADMAPSEVESRCRSSYEHVRRVHTRDEFERNYKRFAESLLAGK